jgi:hypothetical protein
MDVRQYGLVQFGDFNILFWRENKIEGKKYAGVWRVVNWRQNYYARSGRHAQMTLEKHNIRNYPLSLGSDGTRYSLLSQTFYD